jgi:hypothetical protein
MCASWNPGSSFIVGLAYRPFRTREIADLQGFDGDALAISFQ